MAPLIEVDDVIAHVAGAYNTDPADLLGNVSQDCPTLGVALYLANEYGTGVRRLSQDCPMSKSAVARAIGEVRERLAVDTAFRLEVRTIEEELAERFPAAAGVT